MPRWSDDPDDMDIMEEHVDHIDVYELLERIELREALQEQFFIEDEEIINGNKNRGGV